MKGQLREIEALLASRIGLDPVSVGVPRVLRAVRERMKELGLEDVSAYEERLRSSEPEVQALIEEVVVAESWFFRDERPFQFLRQHIRAHWSNSPFRSPVRILSLACAAGEEPYSIAMMLLDLGLPAHRFTIDAVDVSAAQLARARRGLYSRNAFRGSDLAYRDRYFREHSGGYELSAAVRASVRFLQATVLDSRLLEGSSPYDVVLCRNLLIYLSAPACACVLAAIDRMLAVDGLLLVGHADRLDLAGAPLRVTAVVDLACFAYRRTAPTADGALEFMSVGLSTAAHPIAPDLACAITPTFRAVVDANAAMPQPGSLDTGTTSVPDAPGSLPLLDQAAALANQGRFNEAIAVCERHLRQRNLTVAAYYLMGMICQAAGEGRRAEDCFFKVVYLDPRHDEALLALALLAEGRGDREAAASFHRRAERSVNMSRTRVN